MIPDPPLPPRRRRRWLRWVLGGVVAVVLAVAGLAVALVIHSRNNQEIVLPPGGGPLPTSLIGTPEGTTAVYSQTAIQQGDQQRGIAFLSPADAKRGERLPAVVVLHGLDGSPQAAAEAGSWDQAVTADRFVAVFPQGVLSSWNAGGCCRAATTLGIDDVAFLDAVVDDLARRPEIDPTRVYMVGESNGGMAAYAYLCAHAGRLAGAASVVGTNVSGCEPDAPVPVLHVAAEDDEAVPYHGGITAASAAFANGSFPAVEASMAEVARAQGCGETPTSTTDSTVTTTRWDGCRGGVVVQLVSLAGARHRWPTGEPYDATTEVLRFFGLAR